MVDLHGPEVLKHKVFNKVWTPEEKLELVSKVIAGIPRMKVAIEAGISAGMLYQWVHKYKLQGYNGLVESKKGRPDKGTENEEINKSITFNRIGTRRTDTLKS